MVVFLLMIKVVLVLCLGLTHMGDVMGRMLTPGNKTNDTWRKSDKRIDQVYDIQDKLSKYM